MTALERGIERLIDIYTSGLIDKAEFEPRITGQRQRMAQLSKHKRVAVEAVESERELSLVISQLEEFSARVAQGLGQLDWLGRREVIHTLVRRIEIDHDDVEIVFRVPPIAGRAAGALAGISATLYRRVRASSTHYGRAVSKDAHRRRSPRPSSG